MKTLYFDSNYLFRLYSTEPGASEVQKLAGQANSLVTAWHGRAELASILLRKRRESSLSDEGAEEVRHQIRDDLDLGLIEFLPLTEAVMARLESVLSSAPPMPCTSPAPRNTVLRKSIPTTASSSLQPRFSG